MYARNVTLHFKANTAPEFTRTLETDVLPVLRKQNGFKDEITFLGAEADAEAIPALGAAVLVDRHRESEGIPARNGGQERGVYLPNGLGIRATVKPFTNPSLAQYRASSAAGVR